MDTVAHEIRSRIMSAVKSKNTRPELMVRHALHRLGFRYRLHVKDLPGCPDIVLPKHFLAIQVRGCFWHGHECTRLPKANRRFWKNKVDANKVRDGKNDRALRKMGWRLVVVRECHLKRENGLEREINRIVRFIRDGNVKKHFKSP